MDLKSNLFDYEKMTNDRGVRVVAFGKQAGQCGTINAFHSLNHRLQALKEANPFACCKQAKEYPNFVEAKADLVKAGEAVMKDGLPNSLVPMVIGVTGRGNVASGVFDVLGVLPNLKEWTPAEMLKNIKAGNYDNKTIYKVVMDAGELYELKENPDPAAFTFAAFGAAPESYTSAVPRFLPHFSVFINAVFWKNEFPKFITKEGLKTLWESKQCRLVVISDVTCDIEGCVRACLPACRFMGW